MTRRFPTPHVLGRWPGRRAPNFRPLCPRSVTFRNQPSGFIYFEPCLSLVLFILLFQTLAKICPTPQPLYVIGCDYAVTVDPRATCWGLDLRTRPTLYFRYYTRVQRVQYYNTSTSVEKEEEKTLGPLSRSCISLMIKSMSFLHNSHARQKSRLA